MNSILQHAENSPDTNKAHYGILQHSPSATNCYLSCGINGLLGKTYIKYPINLAPMSTFVNNKNV